jgi:hypothetical protein
VLAATQGSQAGFCHLAQHPDNARSSAESGSEQEHQEILPQISVSLEFGDYFAPAPDFRGWQKHTILIYQQFWAHPPKRS